MNKRQTLKNAEAIGPEALKFTTWYFDQVENHGLVDMSMATEESMKDFLNGVMPKRVEDVEGICRELNAMEEAPSLPILENL